jgi:lysophospholipase L1-like esterase
MPDAKGLWAWLAGAAALAMPLTAQAQVAPNRWAGAWGYATSPATRTVKGELPVGTYRFRMRLSRSGHGLRLTFSNPIGADPLRIASATVARAGEGFAIVPGSEATLSFDGGQKGATITGGAVAFAQTDDFAAHGSEDVMVTVTTSAPSTTVAGAAAFPAAFAAGVGAATDAAFLPQKIRPFVSLIAVGDPGASCTIVTFGDSITEGARGTRPDWRGWPGELAQRLVASRSARACGVVNMGISGNRLLAEGRGTAGIDRFDRDVASVPGASHLILLEGINDLWRSALPGEKPVAAADLEDGYRRLIAAAHGRGMRVYGATLTPGDGSKYLTPEMEQIRQQVNLWIRGSGAFDGVIDFEKAVADDASPPHLRPAFDSGDHLHPNDNGYRAMGQAIPLSLFAPSKEP